MRCEMARGELKLREGQGDTRGLQKGCKESCR